MMSDPTEIFVKLADAIPGQTVDTDGRICIHCNGCGEMSPAIFRYGLTENPVVRISNVELVAWLAEHGQHKVAKNEFTNLPDFDFGVSESGGAMGNPHGLMSWPDFEAAARKADALWSNLNMDERRAIKDNVTMPPDVAVHVMQKALQKICPDVKFWEVGTERGSLIVFTFGPMGRPYIHQFEGVVEMLSGSIIEDIIFAVADYHEKHIAT